MDDSQLILKETGSSKKRLRISLKKFKDNPILDMRYFFENNKGEMQATQKGLTVTRNRFLDIFDTLKTNYEEILSFLETGIRNDNTKDWTDEKISALKSLSSVSKIEKISKEIPGKDFSDVTYEGAKALVCLKLKNKYVKSNVKNNESIKTLNDVALALDLAHRLVSEEESNEVQYALEKFCSEFSRQLQNLPEGN